MEVHNHTELDKSPLSWFVARPQPTTHPLLPHKILKLALLVRKGSALKQSTVSAKSIGLLRNQISSVLKLKAGERFRTTASSYKRGAHGICVVCDVVNTESQH